MKPHSFRTFLSIGLMILSCIIYTSKTSNASDFCQAYWGDRSQSFDFPRTDWMSLIPDNVRISRLTIPGTHESQSRHGTAYLWCQALRIGQQLRVGIRALDIRVRRRYNYFHVHHGGHDQKAHFGGEYLPEYESIADTVITFLVNNPTETVIMRLFHQPTDEYNYTRSVEEILKWYLEEDSCIVNGEVRWYRDFFWQSSTGSYDRWPTLGEVRGKIIILQQGDGFSPSKFNFLNVGDSPESVVAADLDGDGDMDLATANSGDDEVTLRINNGDSTFANGGFLTVGDNPRSIVAADLDGDGDMDLATANNWSNDVTFRLNNGDATFKDGGSLTVGDDPQSIVAADLDGDGDMDLATANFGDDEVTIRLNNGDATFAAKYNLTVEHNPRSIVASDLDGDGDIDLAIANSGSDNITIRLNNGDATFAARYNLGVGDNPYSIVASDLDGDGDMDLATANNWSNDVTFRLNNGDATFKDHPEFGPSWFSANIQDNYEMVKNHDSFNKKAQDIKDHINAAKSDNSETLYINFTSGACYDLFSCINFYPRDVANGVTILFQWCDGMNQRTMDWLRDYTMKGNYKPCGIIMSDFPGGGLIDACIAQNGLWNSSECFSTAVQETEEAVPYEYYLGQNYPNPFNPTTKIKCSLPKRSHVTIEVINLVGQKVTTVYEGTLEAGTHEFTWDVSSKASGLYFYRLTADDFVETKKMLLLK